MSSVSEIIQKNFQTFDEKLQKKIISHEIFFRWEEIASPIIAKDIFPMKIDGTTLIVYAKNSAAKDSMKFLAQNILDNANKILGDGKEIFTKIAFAKSFERLKKFHSQKKVTTNKNISSDIELTAEEITDCKKKVENIKNLSIKQIALEGLIKHKKAEKIKLKLGWHNCRNCGVLCKPEEIFCNSCKTQEKNKMREEIRQIFYKNPEKNFPAVLQEIQKKFPYFADECDENIIAFERSAMIREIASRVSTGDKTSELAKTLVMLYKCVPKEKLTDNLMNRALYELRFDLADRLPLK